MKTKKPILWIIPIFVLILLMPLQGKLAVKNEAQASEHKPKVLLFIRKGISHNTELMLKEEVGVMTSMLEVAGFEVIVATASGELIESLTTNRKLMPDLKLADVKVDDYVGIIMPCMAKGPAYSSHASPEEILLVKEAVAQGKLVAAQRGAIAILAEAGVLAGKKYAYDSDLQFLDSFAGATYGGDGVIRDGNIMTSTYCPYGARYYRRDDGTSELTKLFIRIYYREGVRGG